MRYIIGIIFLLLAACTPLSMAQRACTSGYTPYAQDGDCVDEELARQQREAAWNRALAASRPFGSNINGWTLVGPETVRIIP